MPPTAAMTPPLSRDMVQAAAPNQKVWSPHTEICRAPPTLGLPPRAEPSHAVEGRRQADVSAHQEDPQKA